MIIKGKSRKKTFIPSEHFINRIDRQNLQICFQTDSLPFYILFALVNSSNMIPHGRSRGNSILIIVKSIVRIRVVWKKWSAIVENMPAIVEKTASPLWNFWIRENAGSSGLLRQCQH